MNEVEKFIKTQTEIEFRNLGMGVVCYEKDFQDGGRVWLTTDCGCDIPNTMDTTGCQLVSYQDEEDSEWRVLVKSGTAEECFEIMKNTNSFEVN